MSRVSHLDRRSFLASIAAVGGALVLGFEIPLSPARATHAAASAREITAWIVIEPDETVIIRVAKSEMGQGSFTALPMLVAEELECDWSKVTAEFAPPPINGCPMPSPPWPRQPAQLNHSNRRWSLAIAYAFASKSRGARATGSDRSCRASRRHDGTSTAAANAAMMTTLDGGTRPGRARRGFGSRGPPRSGATDAG